MLHHHHPPIHQVLERHTGQRIDHLFTIDDNDVGIHRHSHAAFHLLQKFQYARLDDGDNRDQHDAHPASRCPSVDALPSLLDPSQPLAWQVLMALYVGSIW